MAATTGVVDLGGSVLYVRAPLGSGGLARYALEDVDAELEAERVDVVGERGEALGGAATYFSAAASLFTHVDIVAVVGEDFPRQHVDFLASKGIGLEGLERRPGRTFRWTGEYGFDLNEAKTLKTELNVFESFHPKVLLELDKTGIADVGAVEVA